jgi:prophage regulatory protein
MSGVPIHNDGSGGDLRASRRSHSHPLAKKMPQYDMPVHAPEMTEHPIREIVFIRLPDVKAVTGLSKTSIYELIRERSFPAPVRLGSRAVAWVKSEVRQWAMERIQASRSAA